MRLFFFFAFVAAGFSQQPVQIQNPCLNAQCYHAYVSTSVAASGSTVFTVQTPATGFKYVQLQNAVVQCPGQSFSVAQAQNGTPATTTAGTVISLLPTTVASASKVFTSSNVGSGTAMSATLVYTAGDARIIDLSQRVMNTASQNYSITLTNNGAASCTAAIDVFWYEK
jgi:hypothetical protein